MFGDWKGSCEGRGGLASSFPTMISMQGKVTSVGSLGELATYFLWLADREPQKDKERGLAHYFACGAEEECCIAKDLHFQIACV